MTGSVASTRYRRPKAFFIVAGIILLAGVAVLAAVYYRSVWLHVEREKSDLVTLMELRRSMLSKYSQTIRSEIVLWSSGKSASRVAVALTDLTKAWGQLGDDPHGTLQQLYLEDNPHPTGKKHLLADARDGSEYSRAHAETHDWMLPFLEHEGYYDVFLLDLVGNLVYTVFKEQDYATNIVTGQWRDTGLGEVFRAARDAKREDFVAFSDFAAYGPSHGDPACFIASPVWNDDNRRLGVLAFQVPSDHLNDMMRFTAGMGDTGETYIVGPDLLMRSDSRFSEKSTILEMRVDTETVGLAIGKQTGVQVTPDYRGVSVLSAYGPLTIAADSGQVTWAVMAEIDEAEVFSKAVSPRRLLAMGIIVLASVGALIVGAHIFFVVRAERPTDWT